MKTIKREIQELKQHKVALIITIVCALFLLWLIVSYIDVIMHNGIGIIISWTYLCKVEFIYFVILIMEKITKKKTSKVKAI